MTQATTTRVIHVRDAAANPDAVYIGRAGRNRNESIWHNPFHIGKDGDRTEVIAKYRAYLLRRPDLLARLPELRGKTLMCFCAPLPCHGDVLIELVDAMEGIG